jgi:hypothetical protein
LKNSKLDQDKQEIANQDELLQKDRDIHEWMRLRDVHIADMRTLWDGTDRWTKLAAAFFYTSGRTSFRRTRWKRWVQPPQVLSPRC